MKKLLNASFSKIYVIGVILISVLLVGGYFSYAMFTVSKEKSNAISIVTGNLDYELLIDGVEGNALTVEANTVKDFTIALNNPNNRIARFNFYYVGDLPSNTKVGYIAEEGTNTLPDEKGINLEKVDTTGSSNTYIIRLINNSSNSLTVNLGVSVGLDYNDLSLPENGHLFDEITYKGEVGTVVLSNISKDNTYDDGYDTFTTGQYPNNYVWYSGKLWRAVSVNNEKKTVKLVTQWNISAIPYSSGSTDFAGSYMEEWLNDTTVDGFLGNLRDYENFIVTDAAWDATMDDRELGKITRPDGTTTVTTAVGLLNVYEYQTSYTGSSYNNGYLNNRINWWSLTAFDLSKLYFISSSGSIVSDDVTVTDGVRPSINLKSNIKIVNGNGSKESPYRIERDNDTNLEGTFLNTRYSGEYITFGNDENNLYRIVSHETEGLTKITSAEPLKENGTFKTMAFGDTANFSESSNIESFLIGEFLTSYVGENYINMIESNTTWYLGQVYNGQSYKLAKYANTSDNIITSNTSTSTVGLLRLGELMSGQFNKNSNNITYWTLTPYFLWSHVRSINYNGFGNYNDYNPTNVNNGIKPSLNLKQNVIITSGDGTKENPFQIELAS